MLLRQVMAFNAWREGMDVVVRHLHRGDLPPFVLASSAAATGASPAELPSENGAASSMVTGSTQGAPAQQLNPSPGRAATLNSAAPMDVSGGTPTPLSNGKRKAGDAGGDGGPQDGGRAAKQARLERGQQSAPAPGEGPTALHPACAGQLPRK